jgi:hypothetical protein
VEEEDDDALLFSDVSLPSPISIPIRSIQMGRNYRRRIG